MTRHPHPEGPIPQSAQIRILTTLLNKLMDREIEQRIAEHGVPLSVAQMGAMRAIYYNPSLTQSELSRRMLLSPATLVPILDALEKHGLARRDRDENDRRRTLVSLTDAGVELLNAFPALHQDPAMQRVIEAMGPAKIQQLVGLLAEMVGHLAGDDPVAQHMLARLHGHTLHGDRCGEK